MIKFMTNRFTSREDGGLSIETVFAVPMLVWALTATFVFWDAFKTLNISQKATYTVADMLSRETDPIDADYLASVHEIFDFLAGDSGDNAIRVTVVPKVLNETTNTEELQLVWSEGSDVNAYTDLEPIRDRLPTLALGEHMIVVESEQEWSPGFDVGVGTYRFRKVAIARPRFSPQLVWDNSGGVAAT